LLAHPEYQGNFQRESKFTDDFTADSLKRGICWNVAQGNLLWWKPYVKFTQNLEGKYAGRVLRTIHSNSAFPFLNYDRNHPNHPIVSPSEKPHYRLAYIVMVHQDAENVEALLDALEDPTVFIYLHVDLSSPQSFHQVISNLVKDRENIAIMPNPFAITWSHISMLWVEIRAFFDLLDLISFDYVINLSGSDYPLKSAKTIFDHLERKPQSNWLWWKADGSKTIGDLETRFLPMYHCREYGGDWKNRCLMQPWEPKGQREFTGYSDLFPQLFKTSQWMILHRSTVEYLRTSEAGKLFLMHSEHTAIPDEMFFATLLATTPFNGRTFRDPKRLMFWNGGSHPYVWTGENKGVIKAWEKHFLWIRKVDVTRDQQLKGLLDDIRQEDKMSNRIVLKYKEGIIPVD
jgi:Core-2/I-Branching enzyme